MSKPLVGWACHKDIYRLTYMLKDKIELHAYPKRNYKPVYADPPTTKWTGLSDEEVMELACACVDDGGFTVKCAYDFAKAIEAKLKEKNT